MFPKSPEESHETGTSLLLNSLVSSIYSIRIIAPWPEPTCITRFVGLLVLFILFTLFHLFRGFVTSPVPVLVTRMTPGTY